MIWGLCFVISGKRWLQTACHDGIVHNHKAKLKNQMKALILSISGLAALKWTAIEYRRSTPGKRGRANGCLDTLVLRVYPLMLTTTTLIMCFKKCTITKFSSNWQSEGRVWSVVIIIPHMISSALLSARRERLCLWHQTHTHTYSLERSITCVREKLCACV